MAQGFATLGAFGFEGRWDYSAIGGVVNLAARLCDEAKGGQILINRRMRAALDDAAETLPAGPTVAEGFRAASRRIHPGGDGVLTRCERELFRARPCPSVLVFR